MGWAIGIVVLFIFVTSVVGVAASMNSSRISRDEDAGLLREQLRETLDSH